MRFLGSDFQINKDIGGGHEVLGNQEFPQATTLSDGRFAVVYQSNLNPTDPDPVATIFNADGTASFDFVDLFSEGSTSVQPVVAALPGGGFGVAFTNDGHFNNTIDPNPNNIVYASAAADAAGTVSSTLSVGDFNGGAGHDDLINPAIATLADGRQVVAFEQVFSASDDNIFLNVVSVDGLSTQFTAAAPLPVATNTSFQGRPTVAAIGNSALVVYEDATGTTATSLNIVARLYDGASNLSTVISISDHTAALRGERVAALDDHRYVIVYSDDTNVFGKIYDTSGSGSLSAEFEIDLPGGAEGNPAVASTADGGFIVSWTRLSGGDDDILARRFNSDGQPMGQQFTVNRLTDNSQIASTITVSGVNAFFGWNDAAPRPEDPDPIGVRGQVMTLTTPPDFNDNGISDIFWRNTSGALFSWDMDKSGVINSGLNVTFNGVQIKPDASFSIAAISDFNADGRADILWRNTSGFTALWTMNGSVIQSSSFLTFNGVAVNPDPSFSVAGVGDFDFDGKSDILWRSTSGALIMWTMDGPVIASSSFVTFGGTPVNPDASFSVAGIGDFNGDGKSDILWRSTSGEVALWQMNGSVISGSADTTFNGAAVRPDASFSIAAIGDFNADGDADILWRNTSGLLIEWLMNGATIVSSGVVSSNGAQVGPDASWHVVEIGDFNGDARTDMLWRSNSGALAEWLMNGTAVTQSVTPTFNGTAVQPDATFSTQAKPTDFA